MRRLVQLLTALGMIVFFGVPPAVDSAPANAPSSPPNTQLASTGRYLVKLDDQPLTTYRGGLRNYAPTSPLGAGASKFDRRSPASRAYRSYLAQRRVAVLDELQTASGRRPSVVAAFDTVFNGFGIVASPAELVILAKMPGVREIIPEPVAQPLTDVGPIFSGAKTANDVTQSRIFTAKLTGAAVKPMPVTTSASGSGIFTFDSTTMKLCVQLTLATITPVAVTLVRDTGGVNVTVADLTPLNVAGTTLYLGEPTLDSAAKAALFAGEMFVQVTTAANPAGAIRGDLRADQGAGMIVGVIDTGINFTHASFAATGGDGYTVVNPRGSGQYLGVCDPTNSTYNPNFVCNAKLIGAYTFPGTDTSPGADGVASPSDDDGHGSHTASTAAGNVLTNAQVAGTSIGPISGMAPHANIIAYDACGYVVAGFQGKGCLGLALIGAIEQSVIDGVDVVNYSIGSDSSDPWSSFDGSAMLNAIAAGVFFAVAAGNSGPDPSTVGSPSNAPWVTSVAAETHNRVFANSLIAGTATYTGRGFSAALTSSATLVLASTYLNENGTENSLCLPFQTGTDLRNKIVVCDRGTNARVEKAANAFAAGAAGFVLANVSASQGLVGDVYPLPGVHLSKTDADALRAVMTATPGLSATIAGSYKDLSASNGGVIAAFSSRGPDATVPTLLKPDLAAPGVDIVAATSNENATTDEFGFLSGTSMATPHIAGAATLVRAVRPTWSPSAVKSALMLTAQITGMQREEDGAPPTPFQSGSGSVSVERAVRTGLILDESPENFAAVRSTAEKDPQSLNLASLAAPNCVVQCTWTRTLSNTLNTPVPWTLAPSDQSGVALTLQPTAFTIPAGGTQIITITVNITTLSVGTYGFGAVLLQPGAGFSQLPALRMPVAVKAGAAQLPQAVYRPVVSRSGSFTIGSLRTMPTANLTIETTGLTLGRVQNAYLNADTDNTTPLDDLSDGVLASSVPVPAGTGHLVAEVLTTTAQDLDMYVFLDGMSGAADGIPTYDEIVCTAASPKELESCTLDAPVAGTYIVVVQNYTASTGGVDLVRIATAAIPVKDVGNLRVTGPKTVAANVPFALNVRYTVPALLPGGIYYGTVSLKSQPVGGSALGSIPITVEHAHGLFIPAFNLKPSQ